MRYQPIILLSLYWLICNVAFAESQIEFHPVSPNTAENSPFEALRLSMFSESTDTPGCLVVNRGVGQPAKGIDEGLQTFIDELISGMQSMRTRQLVGLFHPRLNVSRDTLESVFARQRRTYGGRRVDVSVYRLWAFNTVDGQPGMVECTEDQALVRTQFGYPLQFGLWLQIRGTTELGRVFISIVPVGEQWKIGVWHNQQWTHAGKDPEVWLNDALELTEQKNSQAAYVMLDITYKLLDSGVYIDSQLRRDVKATRDALFTEESWLKELASSVSEFKVVSSGTIFAGDGAGILVRKLTDPMESAVKKREDCLNVIRQIYRQPWAAPLGGAKCAMVTEREPFDRDGVLGGVYFDRSEITDPSFRP